MGGKRKAYCKSEACKVKPPTERRLTANSINASYPFKPFLNMSEEDETAGRPLVNFSARDSIFRWASGDTSKDMPFAAQKATDTERNFGPFKRFCHEEVNTTRNGSCA